MKILFVNLAVALTCLLAIEGAVRLWAPAWAESPKTVPPFTKELGWTCTMTAQQPKITQPPSRNAFRVLVLGDSNTDRHTPSEPDMVPIVDLMARKLGQHVVVRNISCGGWGTDQEYLAYQLYKKQTGSPQLVLLFFTPSNDIFNNTSDHDIWSDVQKPRFDLIDGELVLQPAQTNGMVSRLLSTSHAARHARNGFYLARDHITDRKDPLRSETCSHVSAYADPLPERLKKGWDVTQAILRKLNQEIQQDGGSLAIVYVPSGLSFNYRMGKPSQCFGYDDDIIRGRCLGHESRFRATQPFQMMKEFAEKEGISLVHNIPSIRYFARDHLKISPDCLHMGRLGAEMLSDTVAQFVVNFPKTDSNRSESVPPQAQN